MDSRVPWSGWDIVEPIGHGSFGTVYKISRDLFGELEHAALKVITIPQDSRDIEEMYNDGYDEESITSTFKSYLKSIVAEYALMRKMNGSANIVNCDDVQYIQHDDGIGWDIFIKMELLTPLVKALPNDIPEETVIKLAKDMCAALKLCKKFDIVHRDIKPQNIFVSPNGDFKLGDFGVAKTVEKTTGGTKVGTYKYMAPEVYNNQPYGSAADIYSLGLVLYWMLNHRRMPFVPLPPAKLAAGMEEEARMRRLSGEAIPAPANGSAAMKRIVLKACAYDPKNRYRTAEEMLQDLDTISAETDNQIYAPPEPAEAMPPEDQTVGGFKNPQIPPVQPVTEDKTESVFSSRRDPVSQEAPAETDRTVSAFFTPPTVPDPIEQELPGVLPEPTPEPELPKIPEAEPIPEKPQTPRNPAKWKLPAICVGVFLVLALFIAWLATRNPLHPTETVRGTCGEGVTWVFIGSGRLVIEGEGHMFDYPDGDFPWKQYRRFIDTIVVAEGVKSVSESAFQNYDQLTAVSLPASMVLIGANAFRDCDRLEEIAIPEGVHWIEESAFQGCRNLAKITLPDNLQTIGTGAFQGCSNLSEIIWPDIGSNVSYAVGDFAFEGCQKLTQLQIPYGLGSLGNNAFANCSELNFVYLPNTLFSLGEQVFANCEKLETVAIPDGFTYGVNSFPEHAQIVNTIHAEGECGENLTWSLTSDGVLTIQGIGAMHDYRSEKDVNGHAKNYPWEKYKNIKRVVLEPGVTTIASWAFEKQDKLVGVSIPDSVTYIGNSAFQYCENLSSISIPDSVNTMESNIFMNCTGLVKVTLSDTITFIPDGTFRNCTSLSEIIIPDSVTYIASSAFRNCDSLTAIEIPNSVTTIGSEAFENCDRLSSMVLPDGITKIPDRLFADCSSLSDVTIPDSVISIGMYAFGGCDNLRSLILPPAATGIASNAFPSHTKIIYE